MEFSHHNPVKLASHEEYDDHYYCSIFLRYEKHFEIRVLKLSKDQCITAEFLRIEKAENEEEMYHMIWKWDAINALDKSA